MTVTNIEASAEAAHNLLVRGLPHVLAVAGLGDEARAMLTAYAAKTNDLTAVAAMLTAHLGDDAYRVQGWTRAVTAVAAAVRDLHRDAQSGEIDHPRWPMTVGARLVSALDAASANAAEIVVEMEGA